MNVGPWDRLDNNQAFVPGVGTKPHGANFYPRDMTKEEFERAATSRGAGDSLQVAVHDGASRLVGWARRDSLPRRPSPDPSGRAAAKLRAGGEHSPRIQGCDAISTLLRDALRTDKYQPSDWRGWT